METKTTDIMVTPSSIKVVINNRNRLTTTELMVEKLLYLNPNEKIIIIDNGSTYEPLLNWYDKIKDEVEALITKAIDILEKECNVDIDTMSPIVMAILSLNDALLEVSELEEQDLKAEE